MAIIKLGPVVTAIRGTVGGSIFSANGSGAYVKAWGIGAKKRTEKQASQRDLFLRPARDWAALSSARKAAWAAWAGEEAQKKQNPVGEGYELSGYQAYTNLALWGFTTGIGPLPDPPGEPRPDPPTITSFTIQNDGTEIIASLGVVPAEYSSGEFLVGFISLGKTEGTQVMTSGFLLFLQLSGIVATPLDISKPVNDTVGRVTAGSTAFIRMFRQDLENNRSLYTPRRANVIDVS